MSQTLYDEYKTTKKKTSKKLIIVVLLCVVFLFFFSAVFFVKKENTILNGKIFYALSVGDYASYSRAKFDVDKIVSIGGAGYLYIDKGVSILLFAYTNKDDAISVQKNINQYHTKIVEIKIKKLPAKIKAELLKDKKVYELFLYLEEEIKLWYDYSIEYEKGNMTSTLIVANALRLKTRLIKINTYLGLSDNIDYAFMTMYIENIIEDADNFFEMVSNDDKFNSKIKHFYLSLVIESKNIINNLVG